jgi:hypothetical protein
MPNVAVATSALRLSGAAAVAGGVVRIANSFTGAFDPRPREFGYFVADVLLLFGLLGIYLPQRALLGRVGMAGFVSGVVGILIIRSSTLFGPSGYVLGAGLLLLGLSAQSVVMLARTGLPKLPPVLWLASLLLAVAGAAGGLAWSTELAGVSFGAGFVVAGWPLVRGLAR